MRKLTGYILIGIFAGILAVSGYRLYQIWEGYHAAEEEYGDLRQFIKEKEPYSTPEGEETEGADGAGQQVDFESLRQLNPDIVAWIRIEAAGIDYPVVQGEDNEHYLHYTFRGEASIAGSIFMDYRNKGDFTDGKTILYGHNMRDGSMFAGLKDLDLSGGPVAAVYLPGQELQYRLVEAEYVPPDDAVYQDMKTEARAAGGEAPAKELILSTCSSDAGQRLILRGEKQMP